MAAAHARRHPRPRLPGHRDRDVRHLRARGPCARDALADVNRWLRTFFVGGVIAYRGLFNWIRPSMYIPTMLGSPLFQLIFFTKLGQYANAEPARLLHHRQRDAGLRDVVGVRHDDGRRERTVVRHARPAARLARKPRRRVPRPRRARAGKRPARLRIHLCGRSVLLGFRPGWAAVPALAAVLVVTVDLVHMLRDAARIDRLARKGLLLRREPGLLPDAALLRRQHPALRAARSG